MDNRYEYRWIDESAVYPARQLCRTGSFAKVMDALMAKQIVERWLYLNIKTEPEPQIRMKRRGLGLSTMAMEAYLG